MFNFDLTGCFWLFLVALYINYYLTSIMYIECFCKLISFFLFLAEKRKEKEKNQKNKEKNLFIFFNI